MFNHIAYVYRIMDEIALADHRCHIGSHYFGFKKNMVG
jgi:hypothetical protein